MKSLTWLLQPECIDPMPCFWSCTIQWQLSIPSAFLYCCRARHTRTTHCILQAHWTSSQSVLRCQCIWDAFCWLEHVGDLNIFSAVNCSYSVTTMIKTLEVKLRHVKKESFQLQSKRLVIILYSNPKISASSATFLSGYHLHHFLRTSHFQTHTMVLVGLKKQSLNTRVSFPHSLLLVINFLHYL